MEKCSFRKEANSKRGISHRAIKYSTSTLTRYLIESKWEERQRDSREKRRELEHGASIFYVVHYVKSEQGRRGGQREDREEEWIRIKQGGYLMRLNSEK